MNCEEFLQQFREALDGKVSEQIIQDNVEYYNSYIKGQILNGNSESEVLGRLGDPRLLAKTIEKSSKFAEEDKGEKKEYDTSKGNGIFGQNKAGFDSHIKLPLWLILCVVMIIFVIGLRIAFRVIIYFMPLILILMTAWYIYKLIRDWISG